MLWFKVMFQEISPEIFLEKKCQKVFSVKVTSQLDQLNKRKRKERAKNNLLLEKLLIT
jgi:hypothetical protein